MVTHRCCSVRRRLRPRPLPEQPVLVQGHAESPAELPPPLSRPPIRGLSDGFGAAEGAGLWFPGSQVKAACRGPEVPLFVVPSSRSTSSEGRGWSSWQVGVGAQYTLGREVGGREARDRTLSCSKPDSGRASLATSLSFSRAPFGAKWPSAANRETRPTLEGGGHHTSVPVSSELLKKYTLALISDS